MIGLETEEGRTAYRPGERVDGTISWRLEAPAKAIELRLFWRTSGKGDPDLLVVDSLCVEDPPAFESRRPFRLQLPLEPWSFSGSLITLSWALEAVARPADESALLELVVSPTGTEIRLPRVEP